LIGSANQRRNTSRCIFSASLRSLDWLRQSKAEKMVVRDGIEPPTHGFSVHCSTS
jgi:hypothetical protein